MSVGDIFGNLLDEAYVNQEFDDARVEANKTGASASDLQIVNQPSASLPIVKPPVLKMLSNDRISRKEAEQHLRKLQEMLWAGQRRQFAGQMMISVALHAQLQLDMAQEAMVARYVGINRADPMKMAMARVTVRLWALAEAAVLAFEESFPKAAAEEF
jgi:ABC-type uncharacterized transport system auxiliary subunit